MVSSERLSALTTKLESTAQLIQPLLTLLKFFDPSFKDMVTMVRLFQHLFLVYQEICRELEELRKKGGLFSSITTRDAIYIENIQGVREKILQADRPLFQLAEDKTPEIAIFFYICFYDSVVYLDHSLEDEEEREQNGDTVIMGEARRALRRADVLARELPEEANKMKMLVSYNTSFSLHRVEHETIVATRAIGQGLQIPIRDGMEDCERLRTFMIQHAISCRQTMIDTANRKLEEWDARL